jgi:glycosyltransferase involved in cell wall biosynthesis
MNTQKHIVPKISVIISSLNQSKYLADTIESIVNQRCENVELIILDGGSTDGSIEIIKKYTQYVTYWHSKPDKGQVHAINEGFNKSTGDILTFINSDDMFNAETFKNISLLYSPDKNIVIYGNYYIIDDTNTIQEKMFVPSYNRWIFWNMRRLPFSQPGTFFSRELYFDVCGVNTSYQYSFDRDLFLKFIQKRAIFLKSDYFLAHFRVYSEQKGHSRKWLEIAKNNSADIITVHYNNDASIIKNITSKVLYYTYQIASINMLRTLMYRLLNHKRIKRYSSTYTI